MSGDRVGDAYAVLAPAYIARFGAERQVHGEDLAFIGEHLALCGGPVLDVGCGPGQLSGYLASLGVDVAGVDLVTEFVRHAESAYPNVRFAVGSMLRLGAADHSLAGVLAWYSLIHTPPEDVAAVLREFHRVLAPGGVLVLGLFDGPDAAPFDHQVLTAYTWSLAAMTDVLAGSGFAVIASAQRSSNASQRAHLAVAARAR